MGTDTMILVPASLTYMYKKYPYPLPAGIHFQYLFSTRCGFYPRIPMGTDFFNIPTQYITTVTNLDTNLQN